MLTRWIRHLRKRPPGPIAALAMLLIALVATFDLLTGYELSFSVFYTLPIALGAWYTRRTIAWALCLLATGTWLAIDHLSGHGYSHPAIPWWNAGVRLGFFMIIAELLMRLRTALQLQTEAAQRDGLTGLLNGAAFRRACDTALKLAGRHRQPMALAYVDLDGFKVVNDSWGHDAGDQVLKLIARVLQDHMRGTDLCARVGGDEFAVMLPQTDSAGARTVFNPLHQALNELARRNRWPVGFSMGVALFNSPTVGVDDALRMADRLMYRVKKSGKNSILYEGVGTGEAGA